MVDSYGPSCTFISTEDNRQKSWFPMQFYQHWILATTHASQTLSSLLTNIHGFPCTFISPKDNSLVVTAPMHFHQYRKKKANSHSPAMQISISSHGPEILVSIRSKDTGQRSWPHIAYLHMENRHWPVFLSPSSPSTFISTDETGQ